MTAQLIRKVTSGPSGDGTAERTRAAAARLSRLSDRERDVAVAVGQGKSSAEIAGELFMSVPAVKAHVSHIFVKMQFANRVQVTICVHEAGLAWTPDPTRSPLTLHSRADADASWLRSEDRRPLGVGGSRHPGVCAGLGAARGSPRGGDRSRRAGGRLPGGRGR